ncbi:hypothetical protein Tco_1471288, partial [Tanacetum coccineum]
KILIQMLNMKGEFEMSAMGELTFFLGLQVQQRPNGIFISHDKLMVQEGGLVEANASLSKTLLGDDVTEDNFPVRMAALIKRKKQALAEKLAKESVGNYRFDDYKIHKQK